MAVRVARASGDKPDTAVVLAQEGDGRTMARADVHLAADETAGTATLPFAARTGVTGLVSWCWKDRPRPDRSCCWMSGGGGVRSDC